MVALPTRLLMVGAAALIALAGCTASNAEPQPTPSGSVSASSAPSATDDLALLLRPEGPLGGLRRRLRLHEAQGPG